jgi:TolA-binding protein
MKMNLPKTGPKTRLALLAGVGLSLMAGVVVSQTQPLPAVEWDVRRLDTLDRNVRRLERALTQRNSVGQPVLVEPDPEVVQLQAQVGGMDRRLSDLEQTVQRMNADNERLTFQLDERGREAQGLRATLGRAETRIKALEDAAAAQAAQAAQAQAAAEAAARANPDEALAAAVALLASDPARGAEALEDVSTQWPGTPQGREASWRLGDARRAGNDHAAAVQAYAAALRDWPTAAWAGETTIKLARSLVATRRNAQACAALAEFNRRYAASASVQLKGVATRTGTEARCS